MALTYEELGDGSEALDHQLRALPIFQELEDRRQKAVTFHNIGWLLLRHRSRPVRGARFSQRAHRDPAGDGPTPNVSAATSPAPASSPKAP